MPNIFGLRKHCRLFSSMLDISTPLRPSAKPPKEPLKASKRLIFSAPALSLKNFSKFPHYCHIEQTQLMPGIFSGERTLLVTPGITGLKSTANLAYMQQATLLCPQKFIFGFTSPQGSLFLNGRKMAENDIFIIKADTLYDMVIGQNSSLFTFAINDIDSNIDVSSKITHTLRYVRNSCFADNQHPFRTLAQPHIRDALIAEFSEYPPLQKSTPLELTSQLLDSSNDYAYRPNSRNNLLLRTLRLMQAQPFNFRKISDAAQACHVSQRGLEKAFDDVLNGSPGEYLKAIQLNRYRTAIIQNSDNSRLSLADIAAKLGAVNYSRLSKDYKCFFEELPSNTRRNSSQEKSNK